IKQPELDEEDHESGSVPVSFIFKNVMKSSLKYLNIEPDKDPDTSFDPIRIPEISGRKTADLKKQLEEKGLDVTVIGEGEKVVKANVKKDDKLLPDAHVFLVTDKPDMPDITGWSLRDVMEFADLFDLKVDTNGNGYVVGQSIK